MKSDDIPPSPEFAAYLESLGLEIRKAVGVSEDVWDELNGVIILCE